jgi:phage/conjugal plasmid C-4 type zinc finger TraR family protein
MPDACDMAQNAETIFRREALRKREALSGPSATHCDVCGEPIPEARRTAVPGCRLCVNCQEEMDND